MARFDGDLSSDVRLGMAQHQERIAGVVARGGPPGSGGEGGGNLGERVTRLETHFEYIRRDLDEIKTALLALPGLATKRDLVAWAGIYLLIAALIVGGIIGGLGWIKTEAPATAPVVIQAPTNSQVVPDTSTVSPSRPE